MRILVAYDFSTLLHVVTQCEVTINEAGQYLLTIGTKASTCTTSEDALDLINRLEQYKGQFANTQNGRMAEMDKYAVMLWGGCSRGHVLNNSAPGM